MPSDDHRGSAWILVSVIVLVLAVTGGYFVFVGATERVIENACTTQMERSARFLAKRLHRQPTISSGSSGRSWRGAAGATPERSTSAPGI